MAQKVGFTRITTRRDPGRPDDRPMRGPCTMTSPESGTSSIDDRNIEELRLRTRNPDHRSKVARTSAMSTGKMQDGCRNGFGAHAVPLSTAAVKLLRRLPRLVDVDLVFPAPDGELVGIDTMRAVMVRMGMDEVPHGLRSTFRDWASERTNVPREVAEMAFAHSIRDKTEAAYRRGDLLTKRAAPMQQWADFLSTPNTIAAVVPIAAGSVDRAA